MSKLWFFQAVIYGCECLSTKKAKYQRFDFVFHLFLFSSVQFSHSVMSDSLRPHKSQLARPPCPSPAPRVYSKLMSIESVMLCSHLTLCRSLLLLQSTGVSALASVLPMILEANYFTILYWFLPYIDMNQAWIYMCFPS